MDTTKPTEGDTRKLTHLDEYEAVREEITLYQREMHRTWLWAIIPAGAVYTWLALHTSELSKIPGPVWFIPTGFLIICAGRYWVFSSRIAGLVAYRLALEDGAFADEKETDLGGMAHFIAKRLESGRFSWPKWYFSPKRYLVGARFIWGGLILGGLVLSWTLSKMEARVSPHQAWQYKRINVEETRLEQELNRLGTECWEVVDQRHEGAFAVVFLKRPKP